MQMYFPPIIFSDFYLPIYRFSHDYNFVLCIYGVMFVFSVTVIPSSQKKILSHVSQS